MAAISVRDGEQSTPVVRVEFAHIDELHVAAVEVLRCWQDNYPRDVGGDPLGSEIHRDTTHSGALPVTVVEIVEAGTSWDGWEYALELRQAPRLRYCPASLAEPAAAGSWWVPEHEVAQLRALIDDWRRLADRVPFPAVAAREVRARLDALQNLVRMWDGQRAHLAVASPPGWPAPADTTSTQWQRIADLAAALAGENMRRHEHEGHGKSGEPTPVEISGTADGQVGCAW